LSNTLAIDPAIDPAIAAAIAAAMIDGVLAPRGPWRDGVPVRPDLLAEAEGRLQGPLAPSMSFGLLPVPPAPGVRLPEDLGLVQAEGYAMEVVTELRRKLHDYAAEQFNLRGFGGIRWD